MIPKTKTTVDFAQELIAHGRRNFVTWTEAIQSEPGNPFNAQIQQFGQATAVLNPAFPSVTFNRVYELTQADEKYIPDILDFYVTHKVRPTIEISPYSVEPYTKQDDITLALAQQGFYQGGFHQLLYTVPTRDIPTQPHDVEIVEVTEAEAGDFQDIYTWYAGDGRVVSFLIGHPEYRCYLARVDGKAAGMGILYLSEGVGAMATCVTLPEFRNRGSQTALLYRRIHDAAQVGCELIISGCLPGGSSQNNQLRVGFKLLGSKAWWTTINPTPWD